MSFKMDTTAVNSTHTYHKDISQGDVFTYQDNLYIKTEDLKTPEGIIVNSVRLDTGRAYLLTTKHQIRPVRTKLVAKFEE